MEVCLSLQPWLSRGSHKPLAFPPQKARLLSSSLLHGSFVHTCYIQRRLIPPFFTPDILNPVFSAVGVSFTPLLYSSCPLFFKKRLNVWVWVRCCSFFSSPSGAEAPELRWSLDGSIDGYLDGQMEEEILPSPPPLLAHSEGFSLLFAAFQQQSSVTFFDLRCSHFTGSHLSFFLSLPLCADYVLVSER